MWRVLHGIVSFQSSSVKLRNLGFQTTLLQSQFLSWNGWDTVFCEDNSRVICTIDGNIGEELSILFKAWLVWNQTHRNYQHKLGAENWPRITPHLFKGLNLGKIQSKYIVALVSGHNSCSFFWGLYNSWSGSCYYGLQHHSQDGQVSPGLTDHLSTTYRPLTDHLPTTNWPLTGHLPATYRWPTNHLPTAFYSAACSIFPELLPLTCTCSYLFKHWLVKQNTSKQ